jgi:hypothetical protein
LSDISKEGSGVASGVEPISYSIWFAKEGVDDGSLASALLLIVALSHEFGWLNCLFVVEADIVLCFDFV